MYDGIDFWESRDLVKRQVKFFFQVALSFRLFKWVGLIEEWRLSHIGLFGWDFGIDFDSK